MKKGILVINHFLKSDKFNEIYKWLKKSAYDLNINLSVLTNREIMIDTEKNILNKEEIDFILFWDKDILLARHLENQGFKVMNSSQAIEYCDDKALMHIMLEQQEIVMPRTIIPPFTYTTYWDMNNIEVIGFIDEIIEKLGFPMIIKARKGSFGAQVHMAHNKEQLYEVIRNYGPNDVLFQQYVDTSKGRDMRLQVVGDNVVTSMYRYNDMDFRANITNGGSMKAINPSKEAVELAIKVTKVLGLDFAGVDILFGEDEIPILCEVNSNAHFVNIYTCTGVNVAQHIMEYVLKCIEVE